MKRSTTTPNRRWMLWLLIGVAVALVAGHVAPPLLINLMKLQDTNVSSTYRTAPAEAQLLDVAAFRDGLFESNVAFFFFAQFDDRAKENVPTGFSLVLIF